MFTAHDPFLSHSFFFFNDTATTEIYTLSLHDALPISSSPATATPCCSRPTPTFRTWVLDESRDRKSTRLNSSHSQISYAVFCLKKKKTRRRSAALLGNSPSPVPRPRSRLHLRRQGDGS